MESPAHPAIEDTVTVVLKRMILAATDMAAGQVTGGDRLHEDLGIDSLEMAGLLIDIENHFGVVLTAQMLASISTVSELTAAVERLLREAPR